MPTICEVKARLKSGDNFPVHVTRGHEAEARDAQLHKPPTRFGAWILRRLGYKGEIKQYLPQEQARPSHERAIRRHPDNETNPPTNSPI
jgi:hypothetical protein